MLKVRLQGTKRDISWFNRLLKEHGGIVITEISDIYDNKGTVKYFREYLEVEKRTEK